MREARHNTDFERTDPFIFRILSKLAKITYIVQSLYYSVCRYYPNSRMLHSFGCYWKQGLTGDGKILHVFQFEPHQDSIAFILHRHNAYR